MSKVSTTQRTETAVDTAAPFRWPDANSTAELVLEEGLAFCARKSGLRIVLSVIYAVRRGEGTVCQYCNYGLAKKVAESIGKPDGETTRIPSRAAWSP